MGNREASMNQEGFAIGDRLNNVVVKKVPSSCPAQGFAFLMRARVEVSAKGAVHFELPGEAGSAGLTEAVAALPNLQLPPEAKTKEDVLLHYPIGSKHRLRITGAILFTPKGPSGRTAVGGVRVVDGVLLGTTKTESLKQKIVCLEEARPGMVFKAARVTGVQPHGSALPMTKRCQRNFNCPTGIFVRIYDRIRGFIPALHSAEEPLTRITAVIKEGTKLRCRVLSVDKWATRLALLLCLRLVAFGLSERHQLILTRKPSLVESPLPVVAGFEGGTEGTVTVGTVVKGSPAGLLVAFWGRAKGFVRKADLVAAGCPDFATAFPEGKYPFTSARIGRT